MRQVSKSFPQQIRDTRGQILGLTSLAYVFLAAVFVVWVVNSGMALMYKTKMSWVAQQVADTIAIFMYYAPCQGFQWNTGPASQQVQPTIPAASTNFLNVTFPSNQPALTSSTWGGVANCPATTEYAASIGAGAYYSGTPSMFGSWASPGATADTKYCCSLPGQCPAPPN
jgi:hypothetical protein